MRLRSQIDTQIDCQIDSQYRTLTHVLAATTPTWLAYLLAWDKGRK